MSRLPRSGPHGNPAQSKREPQKSPQGPGSHVRALPGRNSFIRDTCAHDDLYFPLS